MSGFVLHDAVGWLLGRHVHFPEMTLVFALFGGGAILGEAVGMDLSRTPFLVRLSVNLLYIGGCFALVHMVAP